MSASARPVERAREFLTSSDRSRVDWYYEHTPVETYESPHDPESPWFYQVVLHSVSHIEHAEQLRPRTTWPIQVSEGLGRRLADALHEYLTTSVLESARQLIFNTVVRRLREHESTIAQIVESQHAVLERLARLERHQVEGTTGDPEIVRDDLVAAAESALESLDLMGRVECSEDTVRIVISREQEAAAVQSEFQVYKELAARLPLDVFKAVTIDIDIEESAPDV